MITGEQLSAYLAGELDADERRAVESALERDAELRARLERLRESDEMLRSLPAVEPPDGFSERLHGALDRELERGEAEEDELAERRRRRFDAFRPLAVAAAAAAVIALFGVAGTWLLQGGDSAMDTAAGPVEADGAGMAGVPVVETDNDFDEQELRRLAVNAEVSAHVPQDLAAAEATPLAEELQGELLDRTSDDPQVTADRAPEPEAGQEEDAAAEGYSTTQSRRETDDDVARCLPTVLEDARSALIPVYVELARFNGEPAVIYVLATEDPESGTYRRVEVWALARSDCQVLSFAQYDRE